MTLSWSPSQFRVIPPVRLPPYWEALYKPLEENVPPSPITTTTEQPNAGLVAIPITTTVSPMQISEWISSSLSIPLTTTEEPSINVNDTFTPDELVSINLFNATLDNETVSSIESDLEDYDTVDVEIFNFTLTDVDFVDLDLLNYIANNLTTKTTSTNVTMTRLSEQFNENMSNIWSWVYPTIIIVLLTLMSFGMTFLLISAIIKLVETCRAVHDCLATIETISTSHVK